MIVFFFFLSFFFSVVVYFLFLSRYKELGKLGLAVVSISLVLLWIGLTAFLLVAFGLYRFDRVIYSIIFFASIGLIAYLKLRSQELQEKFSVLEIGKKELLLLLIFSLFSFYLYAGFSTQYIDGGRDQGQYTIFGYVIAKTGGFNLDIPDSALIRNIFGDSVLLDYQAGSLDPRESIERRVPAFFHLLPAYLAVGYDLFGMFGLLGINSVFGFLSIFLFYLILRRLSDPLVAGAATVLYVLNVSQLWNVRTTLSEPISQFLILLTAYLLQTFFKTKNSFLMSAIGAVFGISCLLRIDGFTYFPLLAFYSAYLLLASPKHFKNFLFFFVSFSVVSIIAAIYSYYRSLRYIQAHWEFVKFMVIGFGFSVGFIFAEIVIWKNAPVVLQYLRVWLKEKKKFLRILTWLFFIALIGFACFIRPNFVNELNNSTLSQYRAVNSLLTFFWYVPFWLFIFLPFAFDLFLFRRKGIRTSFLFFAGSLLLFLYLLDPKIAPDHFWATRRWVIISIPFAILGSFLGIRSVPVLDKKWKTSVLILGFLSGLAYTIWRSNLILFRPMMESYLEGYSQFSKVMPIDESVYFTTKRSIASPLRYIYGRNIFIVKDSLEFLKKVPELLKLGKKVYIIQNGDFSGYKDSLKFYKVANLDLRGRFPIESVQRFPEFLYHKNLNLQVFRIEISDKISFNGPIEMEWNPAEGGFLSKVGKIEEDGTISATRHRGPLVYGPYLTLPSGKYELQFIGKNLQNAEFDVVCKHGSDRLLEIQKGDRDSIQTLLFEVKRPIVDDLEFRVFVEGKSGVRIEKISLKRIFEK
ncbi:hypothetical protein CH352_04475 [Leptospira hartskeerlii]|uniref:Glycosyltransferase RgtA/B/C/D-like domain-containing protein n=1 Tax=Leptospira hartskeerlii TaxID=2023177 RepID=A0A2M9XG53_9LEPT|nr:hypothetical protein [Leptospira hartskeerlii]PJZ26660.1 hypothetical protein CH357_03980 [Leptospira hartskeerlii]PJZ34858.1 hypothetical protein CH352_04475 [Leptospira hartskeerlii]